MFRWTFRKSCRFVCINGLFVWNMGLFCGDLFGFSVDGGFGLDLGWIWVGWSYMLFLKIIVFWLKESGVLVEYEWSIGGEKG